MRWFKNAKIQNKLFFAFGSLVLMLVALSVFSGIQLYHVNKKYCDVLHSAVLRQSSAVKAMEDLSKLRHINFSKAYLTDDYMDTDAIAEMRENYATNVELFGRHLDNYRRNVNADHYLTESEKRERLEILDETIHLFTHEYQRKTKELDAALHQKNKPEINRIIVETTWIGDQITDNLDAIYEMVSITTEELSQQTTIHSHEAVSLLFGMTAFLVLFSTFVSIMMTRAVKEPILRMENAMQEISKGNLNYPIRSDHNDELGMLANQIGNMVENIAEMNKMMTIMGNLDSMVVVVDFDYHLIYLNQSSATGFGVDTENYKGKKCYQALRNLDRPCSFCQLPQMLREKDSFPSRNYEFLHDDVLNTWIGGTSAIIRWVDGSMVYLQSIKNETERKKNQELLSEALETAKSASAAKSAFLANMSHELRTPLSVVIGLADSGLENEGLSDEIIDNLQKISNAGGTLLSIVNDILDISKIESGKLTLTPVEYHMASLLNDTAILVTSRIGEKPIHFHLNVGDDLPSRLFGDDLRVKQILNNLLSNAIKYTHKGIVELAVRCAREGENDVWLEIDVKDTGIGIRQEDLKKLFSDYNQVDVLANRKIEGTGLGLAITRKLAESMDGVISVDSEYGKGSIFRTRIKQGFVTETPIGPVVGENLRKFRYNENKRHFVGSLVRPDLSYAKVLVVDDLQANLDVAASLMRKYKMQVDCVTSGKAAVERIKQEKPTYNAVFMDHMMPEMDGIEAAEAIRAIGTEYARTIPIIALTANAVVGTEELFYEHGFQAFITKPLDIMRLDSVIQQWVKDKSKEDASTESSKHSAISDTLACNSLLKKEEPIIEIPGVNVEKGLYLCGGNRTNYRSVLRSYVADLSVILEKIRNVTEETLPTYAISVHGIKGASAGIGAEKVREAAQNLEEMAQNGDLSGIVANNDAFLKETECLVTAIKNWLAEQDRNVDKPRLPIPDRALLAGLRQSCEQYDADGIEKAMENLDHTSYDTDADLITWLREKIDTFDFPEIVQRLAKYLEQRPVTADSKPQNK